MTDLKRFINQKAGEIVALGKQHGFSFTEDEVVSLAADELSDDELTGVTGGVARSPSVKGVIGDTGVKVVVGDSPRGGLRRRGNPIGSNR